MMTAIKAEFRKLLTVRSTYIVSLLSIALVLFFSFYVEGMRGQDSALSGAKLQNEILSAVGFMPIFAALVAILLVAHEYRYNTIMYTLTSINRRSKVLLAKLVATVTYTLVFVTVGVALGVLAMYLGLAVKDIALVPQHVYWGDIVWRVVFYSLAYAVLGLVLALLMRNVTAAITTIFLLPSTIEPLLGLLLKENAKYLPMSALEQVISTTSSRMSPGQAALVAGTYLVGAWLVAWLMFVRRDAN